MKTLIIAIMVAVFTLTATFPTESGPKDVSDHVKANETGKIICHVHTPCGWAIYKPRTEIVDMVITNSYCVCSPDTKCQFSERDTTLNVYKCK